MPLSFCKISKYSKSRSRVMRKCHFRAQNDPFVLNNIFFGKNHYYCFHLPIHPFHWAKFIKNSYSRSRVAYPDDALFLGPKWFISPKQIFFWKIIKIILIYLLAPFIVQNFKKILPADPEIWGCVTLGPKMTRFLKWECFQKAC